MVYGYLTIDEKEEGNNEDKLKLEAAAKKLDIKFKTLVEDPQPNRIDWKLRELNELIKTMKKGETLATYEALNLSRSVTQLLEIIEALAKKGINLHLLKQNKIIHPEELVDTKAFLETIKKAESEYEDKRNSEPVEKRNLSGVPLGRPKGRRNKSRKLDKHLPEIKKYLALKISKASIAKLIGCHAQTLYNYLEDKNLLDGTEDNEEGTED
jgi:DNA invertase Pin-like site-specific DNA recombinase